MQKFRLLSKRKTAASLHFFKSNKGSTTIFLTMILISMIAAAFAFVHAADEIAEKSRNDAILRLSGSSILAEYNIPLMERYGIFAFYGTEPHIESRLYFYLRKNCKEAVYKSQISVSLKEHALLDVNVFEQQVLTAAKYSIAADALRKNTSENEKESVAGTLKNSSEISPGAELNNGVIIAGLPSGGKSGNGINITALAKNGLPKFSEVMKAGTDKYLMNSYILDCFNHRKNLDFTSYSYFKNEVEYILYGRMSDAENARRFISDFVTVRTGLNLIHIYSDPAKVKAIAELAALLTPGPEAAITQLALAAAWSYAEAKNDEKLLLADKNVMPIKTKDGWALSLSGAVDGIFNDSMVEPKNKSGLDYEGYLNLFLFLENREIRLLRMMDLIQINMKCLYDEAFLIREYNCGIIWEAQIGGKSYAYTQQYK